MSEILRVLNLSKKYTVHSDYVIKDVSFCCHTGEIVGLIGHNGAGKSTTLKCLLGMIPFDDGKIEINSIDIKKTPKLAKSNVGFVTDNHSVFLKMTGIQYISFIADIYQVPTEVRLQRLNELEEIFKLGESINNLISTYSHGMKQKICMMGSLIHEPPLWVMDEPLVGLDPQTSKAIIDYMKIYATKDKCVLFSSHNLDMIKKICHRVIVIKKGTVIENIDVAKFISQNDEISFEDYLYKLL